jgi:amino acid transporter
MYSRNVVEPRGKTCVVDQQQHHFLHNSADTNLHNRFMTRAPMLDNGRSGHREERGRRHSRGKQPSRENLSIALRVRQYLIDLLVGPPLASSAQLERKIGPFTGLPVFGLDGLSSSAYGPEAALAVLGAAGARYIEPITWIILALLGILYVSYRQTIRAYPNAAGSYVVAKENLGTNLGLLAAAALMIDYVLNVAIGISAGIGALVSAVPSLQPHILMLCLIVLAVISLVNLRGTPEAGWLLAAPTYLFIASMAMVLGIGLVRMMTSNGHPQPVIAPPQLALDASPIGVWLLMRAFASGCTAMTGVEAVSNGVGVFREPPVKHARRTLASIVAALAVLLAGIACLARSYGISAMDQSKPGYQSVLSQLAAATTGRGVLYYVTISAVLSVLILSANTSFADLPRLCSFVAKDKFLPSSFAALGRRLVFSAGIVFLTTTAGVLLIAFDGITDRLIPLFAIGAFTAFSLSQAGMVSHWLKAHRKGQQLTLLHSIKSHSRMLINAVGSIATAIGLLVILVAKFTEGAWIVVIAIPSLITLFRIVRAYYARLEWRLHPSGSLSFRQNIPPVVLLPMEGWNRLAAKAMSFATEISNDVIALHVSAVGGAEEGPEVRALRMRWAHEVEIPAARAGVTPPRLVCVQSRYRRLVEPVLQYVAKLEEEFSNRLIAIVIPELIKVHWWQHLLHNHRALRLRRALLKHGGSRVIVVSIPWYIDRPVELKELADTQELDEFPADETAPLTCTKPIRRFRKKAGGMLSGRQPEPGAELWKDDQW